MSHFCVAVIVDEPTEEAVEKVLAPYDENMEVEPYLDKTKAEIIKDGKNYKARILKNMKENPNYELTEYGRKYLDCETDEDFYNLEKEDYSLFDEEGNSLTTYNPNSKWDWWTLWGRFGTDGTFMRVEDVKLEKEDADPTAYAREWEIFVEGAEKTEEEEDLWTMWKPQYYIERYGNKETYIKIRSLEFPYAFVDKDGWYAQGEMGWFGCDDATKDSILEFVDGFTNYFKDPKNKGKYLVYADLHI